MSKLTQVTRKFSSLVGKVVWESRFLVPGENCEGSLELVSKQNLGLKMGIKKDKILFYEATGKKILVSAFRTNLWYMLKVIADQKAGTADIYLNGKLVAEKVRFSNNGLVFEKLQFSSDSPLWIDDVEVYAWSDYPANYVPEPQVIASKDDIILGVQSCNLWKEGRAYAGWEYVIHSPIIASLILDGTMRETLRWLIGKLSGR